MSDTGLCLLTVHAHPDDEASKGAGTVARYRADGVRTVLVTCTGGEAGDILNPAMDSPEVRERLPEIRREELDRAARIIGYDEVVLLGYRDSGMPDTPSNADPRSFAQAPLDEAVERLVAVIRRFRPQVIVTYPKEQSRYPHPDHLRVNEISEIAFDAAGDPERYPDAGPAWQPARLCYVTWSVRRMKALHDKFVELGLKSPFEGDRLKGILEADAAGPPGEGGDLPRVVVDVNGYGSVSREALLAHATQVDPNSRMWFGLPTEVSDNVYPYEEYEVARDLTARGPSREDLFTDVESVPAGVGSGSGGPRRG
jgi:mycothiol S-conjugate amidase